MEQVSMEERDFHLRAENGLVFTICRIKRESVLDYFYYNLCWILLNIKFMIQLNKFAVTVEYICNFYCAWQTWGTFIFFLFFLPLIFTMQSSQMHYCETTCNSPAIKINLLSNLKHQLGFVIYSLVPKKTCNS